MKGDSYEKLVAFLLVVSIGVNVSQITVFAKQEKNNNDIVNSINDNPYDGITEVYLGTYNVLENVNNGIMPMDNYREFNTYKIYDQGITPNWSWLSNPYFIISIARGMSYSASKTISASISGTVSGSYPSEAKSSVLKAMGLTASGTKTIQTTVKFSGPSSGYSSRDFYYKRGRHTHKVKIVQEHRSNWDGVLWKKTYYASVGVPAIKTYSVDKK